jgi:hypothetical protein
MQFKEDFLNEFRKVIKDILLEGDLERLKLAKEFLGFDNQAFGEFLVPLFKEEQELVLHHVLARPSYPTNLTAVSSEDHNHLSEGKAPLQSINVQSMMIEVDEPLTEEDKQEPTYKWCPRKISETSSGNLCGVVLLTERGFEIEDVETGEVLYEGNFSIYKQLDLSNGLVISFSLTGSHIYNVAYESEINPKNNMVYIQNCPLQKDEQGYYVPTDFEGNSLKVHGSRCGVYNVSDFVVKRYGLADATSVDLVLTVGEVPRIAWVHHNTPMKPTSKVTEVELSTPSVSSQKVKSPRTFAKYDFDLVGKKVAILGLPKSLIERFKTLVLKEKGAEELEFIDSSSHEETVNIPNRLKDFDIIVIVKRFVGHSTIYRLKTVLTASSAQMVNTTSHGLDALERALYRASEGLSAEEGTTTVNYPLLP